MTNKEAYEGIKEYFSRPGAVLARHGKGGQCSYLTGEGNKCAVGCLIPSDEYTDRFEGKPVDGICTYIPALTGVDISFLMEVQDLHDVQADDVPHFLTLLDKSAADYGLV